MLHLQSYSFIYTFFGTAESYQISFVHSTGQPIRGPKLVRRGRLSSDSLCHKGAGGHAQAAREDDQGRGKMH